MQDTNLVMTIFTVFPKLSDTMLLFVEYSLLHADSNNIWQYITFRRNACVNFEAGVSRSAKELFPLYLTWLARKLVKKPQIVFLLLLQVSIERSSDALNLISDVFNHMVNSHKCINSA